MHAPSDQPPDIYRSVFEAARDAILVVKGGEIMDCNPAALNLFGRPREEITVAALGALTLPQHEENEPPLDERIMQTLRGEKQLLDWAFARPNGDRVDAEVSLAPFSLGGEEMVLAVIRDASDRKKAERERDEALDILRHTWDATPCATLLTRASDGTILDANRSFEFRTGYSRQEFIGKKARDLFWASFDRESFVSKFRESGEISGMQYEYCNRAGERRTAVLSARMLELKGEKCIITISYDITDMIRVEESLRENEKRLRRVLEESSDAFYDWNLVTDEVVTSPKWRQMMEYDREENQDVLWSNTFEPNGPPEGSPGSIHPDDAEECGRRFLDYLEGRSPHYYSEHRVRTYKGNYVWIMDHGSIVEWDETGKPIRICGTHTDITARKTAEAALRKSEERLQLVLEGSSDAFWDWDLVTGEMTSSARWAQIIGKGDEHNTSVATVLTLSDFTPGSLGAVHPDDLEECSRLFEDHYYGRTPFYYSEHRVMVRGGTYKWILDRGKITSRAPDGTPLRFSGTHTDVTDRKLAEERLRESEERLMRVLEGSNDAFWDWDLVTGRITSSPHWAEMIGADDEQDLRLASESTAGQFPIGTLGSIHPDDQQRCTESFEDHFAGRTPYYYSEHRVLVKGGKYKWILDRGKITARTPDGTPIRFSGTHTDITDRKEAEEALRLSEERLKRVLEGSNDDIWDWDLVTDTITSSPRWAEIIGADEETGILGPQTDVHNLREGTLGTIHPDDREDCAKAFDAHLRGETDQYYHEHRILVKGGGYKWLLDRGKVTERAPDGTALRFSGTHTDINDRKEAEEKLRESEERLRLVLEGSNVSFYDWDMGTGTLLTSLDWQSPTQEKTGEMVVVRGVDASLIHPDDREAALQKFRDHIEGRLPYYESEHRLYTPARGYVWIRDRGKILTWDQKGAPLRMCGTLTDITERRAAEEENRHLRNYLSNVVNSMPSVLLGVDAESRVTQWNKAAERATGITAEEARGQIVTDLIPALAQQTESIRAAVRKREVQNLPKIARATDGETRYQDIVVYPLVTNGVEGAVVRIDDVTDRVRVEEMMIQSEKMLSVGGLAAGMAHEVNNPLGVILQAAQNVLRRLSPDLAPNREAAEACGFPLEKMREYLERRDIITFINDIRESGERASEIVRNMLSFSRKGDGTGSSTDIPSLLDRTLSLAASDYDLKKRHDFRRIEIVKEYESNLPPVICQPGKIQQVLLNILRNGAEAMPTQTDSARVPRFVLRVAREGTMLRVEIEDNGAGMPERTRRRVFEPFFTTKSPGIGTGLGLSVSYFIITEEHHGTMTVESTPGVGSKFVIRLPIQTEAPNGQ